MGRILHLLKGGDAELALAAIERQLASGDHVTAALLHGTEAPLLPKPVRVLHVPKDLSYDGLLEEIFAADHVITW